MIVGITKRVSKSFFRNYSLRKGYAAVLSIHINPTGIRRMTTGKGKQQPFKFKFNFQVRSAFSSDLLPFVGRNDFKSGNFERINDNIPLVNVVEKSKIWRERNFGIPIVSEIQSVDSNKNIVNLKIHDKTVSAYQKVVHILDAYRVLRYGECYTTWPILWSQFDDTALINPNNQAYVDAMGSYLAGSLKTQLKSPHFPEFYQAFRAVAKEYKFNIGEDIDSYRYTKWFWNAYDNGNFQICMREKESGRILSTEEMLELLRPAEEDCEDSSTEEDDSEDSLSELEELGGIDEDTKTPLEDALEELELDTDSDSNSEPAVIYRHSVRNKSASVHDEEEEDEFEEYTIHAILKDMPSVILHTELMEGMMDDLLEEEEFEEGWEHRWTCWLYQVIAGLAQLQSVFHLIHNDLHTNNIMWKKTDAEFFTYKLANGKIARIPTFGKRFTIIDYGRATFTFNGIEVMSSDFSEGKDAYGQYNYGPSKDVDMPLVRPNPSFDLARLACSLLRGLYPENPIAKKSGAVISKEGDWEIRETESELFNMLWNWLTDCNGENILETEEGDEKFPGFDLYQYIAANCKRARPLDWLEKKIYNQFYGAKAEGDVILVP
jgi:hypothetical protein